MQVIRAIGLVFLLAVLAADSALGSNLGTSDIQFEPIKQGKNVLRVKVENKTDSEQVFGTHIYTRSPDYGKKGVGWGTVFHETLKPNETKLCRFAYKIQGPPTENTWLRLKFYNATSVDALLNDKPEPFFEKRYSINELNLPAEILKAETVPDDIKNEVVDSFRWLQQHIKKGEYEKAWELFSRDYQQSEFQQHGIEAFIAAMEPKQPIDAAFHWQKDLFVELKSIIRMRQVDKAVTFEARGPLGSCTITFAKENDKWKLDDIIGYVPQVLVWQDWENTVLPSMVKHGTEHFEIFCFKDSTAAKDIEKIAKQKEQGYKEICKFLDKKTNVRIRLVLFESKEQKHWMTGHQGMGWAYGNTIVEVYNEKERLDAYHETTHILMRDIGNPPALFNEGFAVYMSERLGEYALKNLSGGESMIYERVQQLDMENKLIPLEQLLTYTEIGSKESNPPVAYPEAASFVKFLIETHDKDKFLQTYSRLYNTDNPLVHQQNLKKLEKIYGQPLEKLEKHWYAVFSYPTKTESMEQLRKLGNLIEVYAADNRGMLPEILQNLNPYVADKDYFKHLKANVVYIGTGRKIDDQDPWPLAYDKKLLESEKDATCALFAGGKVKWIQAKELDDLRTPEQKQRESEYEFAIFIVQTPIRSYGLNLIHPDVLELSPEPTISSDDIISYDWASHEIILNNGVKERLPKRAPVAGKPFVVVAGGKRCYTGAFWTGFSSIASTVPVIMTEDIMAGPDDVKIKIEAGYPSRMLQETKDARDDLRVRDVLRRAGKLTCETKPGETTSKQPAEETLRDRLESTVDLSELSPEVGLSRALKILENSTEPPLNIIALWRDLEQVGIERNTQTGMDAISDIPLKTTLKLLLESVSGGSGEIDYTILDGVIVIATEKTLANLGPETRIYDISDLAQLPAEYRQAKN